MPGFLPRRKYVSTECVQRILPPLYAREPSHCKGLRAFEYVSTVPFIKSIKCIIYYYKFAIYHALNILTHTTRAAKGRRAADSRPYGVDGGWCERRHEGMPPYGCGGNFDCTLPRQAA